MMQVVAERSSASFRPLVDIIDQEGHQEQVRGCVLASVHPGAGEATAVWMGSQPSGSSETAWSETADDEKARLNAKRSLLRTKSTARRFCIANLLTVNWTLTTADGCTDRRAMIRRTNRFLTRLREHLGEEFPYLYVLEFHADGQRYHVHLLLQERFLDKHWVDRTWGAISWFSRHDRDKNGNKLNARNAARAAAGYLLKYVSKDWNECGGQHRYERSSGFNGEVIRRTFRTFAEALAWIAEQRDGDPVISEWESESVEDWHGPPVRWLCW